MKRFIVGVENILTLISEKDEVVYGQQKERKH